MNEALRTKIANQFKNTQLGFLRIKKNLNILNYSDGETEKYLKEIIFSTPIENIETRGKNYYFTCHTSNTILTINSHSLTVITAKQITKTRFGKNQDI